MMLLKSDRPTLRKSRQPFALMELQDLEIISPGKFKIYSETFATVSLRLLGKLYHTPS